MPRNELVRLFAEPKDTPFSRAFLIVSTLFFLGVCAWFLTNTSMGDRLWLIALIYFVFLIPAFVIILLDAVKEPNKLASAFGFGSIAKAGIAITFAIIAFLLLDIVANLSFAGNLSYIMAIGVSSFFFYVVVAPFVEETIRYAYTPTLISIADYAGVGINSKWKNVWPIISIPSVVLGLSVGFGIFHWKAYEMSSYLIAFAVFYGVIFTIGNYITKSAFFSIALHAMHNFLAYWIQYGAPEIPLPYVLVGGLLLLVTFLVVVTTTIQAIREGKLMKVLAQ